MATSYRHAEASARIFGGEPEDYLAIHEFIDSSKQSFGDVRHRAMFHHTHGPWICQEIFGRTIEIVHNGKTKKISVREIAEKHIVQDLGCIPSPSDWYNCMSCKTWMGGKKQKTMSAKEFIDGV